MLYATKPLKKDVPMQDDLRIVIYQEDGMFIAQCLEYDICTQGASQAEVRERMECLIDCERDEMEKSGQQLDPAPDPFHKMWDKDHGSLTFKEVAA